MAYSLVVRDPCIEEQVQGSKPGWHKAAFVFVLEFIFFFSPLKVWGPWSVNELCFQEHAEYWISKHCNNLFYFLFFSLSIFLYLLELNDKKNKMG